MNKAIVRWAGGKYRNLKHILPHLPEGNRLVEPFAGGAVVSLNVGYGEYLINDICEDLINLYQQILHHKELFIEISSSYFTPRNNTAEKYLEERKIFNDKRDMDLMRAVRFLYLNKHGFNGLCRFSQKGTYNVPFGQVKKPYFPEKEIENFIQSRFIVECMPFTEVFKHLKEGDVVYCDPPYVPLSETAKFASYDKSGFSAGQQIELARLARDAEVPVLVSNHDTPLTRDLYKDAAEIHTYSANRSISCEGHTRKPVQELLAIFR
jgi:DNA adenine methylase